VLVPDGPIIPLFNPRRQYWQDHFTQKQGAFDAQTLVGEATIKLLELNRPERVEERLAALLSGFSF
jgi:hypothetical protein